MAHAPGYRVLRLSAALTLVLTLFIISRTLSVQAAPPPALAACADVVVNGGFETNAGWILGPSPIPPGYVGAPVHTGGRAMRLGNVGQPNLQSFSSVRQTITIPAAIASAQISFWVWTQSEPSALNDRQELILLPPGADVLSTSPVQILWRTLSNTPSWTLVGFDLSSLAGQTFDIYFNVFNDGFGGRSAMFLDDVTLTVCQGTPGTPAATPTVATATPTPTPTGALPANITWVGNLTPNGNSPQTINTSATLRITAEVYAAGVTNLPGQGPGIGCWLHYGQVPAFGGPWSNTADLPMAYDSDAGNNDRYGLNLGPLPLGLYEYTAYCSNNGGVTPIWADNSATGGNGKLIVASSGPTATWTPSMTPTPTATPTGAPTVNVVWVGNLAPSGNTPQTIDTISAIFVTVQVYAPGITEPPGQGPGIICRLHYGQVPFFGGGWSGITDVPLAYNGDAGNNDRYGINMGPLLAGLYEYTAWCSGNNGATRVWSDNAATGGNGKLTVVGSGPTATWTPIVPPPPTPPTPPTVIPPSGCVQLVANGGFEFIGNWFLGPTALQPRYVSGPLPLLNGSRSMLLGAMPPSPSVNSYSSIRQRVSIPAWAASAVIEFWYYPSSDAAPGGFDYQELVLLDSMTNATIQIMWRVTENDQAWKLGRVDMSAYRGWTLDIYFNARNSGNGRRTAMLMDDINLWACQSGWPAVATPLPVPLPWFPSPTFPAPPPTPWPTASPPFALVFPSPAVSVVPATVPPTPVELLAATPTPTPEERGLFSGEGLGSAGPVLILCLLGVLVLLTVGLVLWLFGRGKSASP